MHELLNIYIPLDEFFMRENIRKAIDLNRKYFQEQREKHSNEHVYSPYGDDEGLIHPQVKNQKLIDEAEDDEEEPYSEFVDDVFYILRKSAARSIESMNVQLIMAILNHINGILTSTVREELISPLQVISKQKSNYVIEKGLLVSIMLAFNNLDACSEFIIKMKQYIDKTLSDDSVLVDEHDRNKVKSCAADFTHSSMQMKELIKSFMQQLVVTYMKESIVSSLQQFEKVNYDITENEFIMYENHDPFAQHFLQVVSELLEEFEETLTANTLDSLIQEIVILSTLELEQMVLKKRFSQIGGLQFDKDVRALLSFFTSRTQRTVRDKYARLTQIASILKVSKIQEVLEYWGESSVVILTANEVRNILALRVGFSREAIAKLKL